MQLSAANLIIASQQIARGAKAAPDTQAQFASALAKEKNTPAPGAFEPMEFRQTAAPSPAPASAAPAQVASAGYNAAMRLGATIDIRV